MKLRRSFHLPILAAGFAAIATPASAALVSYYVGIDGRETIPSGTYAGLPNPNYNRLTLLFAHHYDATPENNHYHAKSTLVYTGPNLGAGTAVTVTSSNYLPEGSAPPLLMSAGSGIYAGKSIVLPDPANAFSLLNISDTQSLTGFAIGSGEELLYNSSGGRWTGLIAGADVHLELVSKSAGLFIGNASSLSVGLENAGDDLHLGDEVDFTPVFWVDANAAPGVYTATFRLVDEEGFFGSSGEFEFRFQAVPEPSTALLGALALMGGVLRRRR
jgi:hypothetical protein